MIGFIDTEMKKASCANFKNSTNVELNQVMEGHFNSEFIKYKAKCENLLTETITLSKMQVTSLKEECETKDLIIAKLIVYC